MVMRDTSDNANDISIDKNVLNLTFQAICEKPNQSAIGEYNDHILLLDYSISRTGTRNEPTEIIMMINKNNYFINKEKFFCDALPFIENTTSNAMVPIRFIAEAIQATVIWDDKQGICTILHPKYGTTKISGNSKTNEVQKGLIVNSRLFVSTDQIADYFNGDVNWNKHTNEIKIKF